MSGAHRISLQAAWDAVAGGASWVRSFGRPTGVAVADRIWLVIERPAACTVLLNGRHLPPIGGGLGAWRHDVTAALRPRNELRLEFAGRTAIEPGRAALPESLGSVALEIEPAR